MRKTHLASATLASLALLASAALAQTPAPDSSPAATPPAAEAPPADTAAPDAAAPSSTMAPATMAPPHHHHHRAAAASDSADPSHFVHEPGTGLSGPASERASNIDSADSRSPIAPHLPAPPGGESAGYMSYLHDADHALALHHTGAAQQALEMAEIRLLDRSTPVGTANQPDQAAIVQQVSQARQALGHGDMAGARSAIQTALRSAPGAP